MGQRGDFRRGQNNGPVVPPISIPIRDFAGDQQRAQAHVRNLHMQSSLQIYGLLARESFMGQEVGQGVPVEELSGLAEWSKFAAAVWLSAWGLMEIRQKDQEEPVEEPEVADHPDTILLPTA